MNSEEVNLYYQDLELTGGNYLESILNVSLFKMRNIRRGFSSDKDKWKIIGIAEDITKMDPLDLNAIRKYILKEHIFFSITRKTISEDFFPGDLLLKTFFRGPFLWVLFFIQGLLSVVYLLFNHDI